VATNPIESAGWISEPQVACDHLRHGVHPEALHARLHISNIGEPQSEDFAEALVFIGKNSKEK
jgi:hypothetical protein